MNESVISVNNLEFFYQQNKPILKIESLDIFAGESVFLYGPSGSGKTTLLGLFAGILQPKRGSLKILSSDLSTLSASARDSFRGNHIGYIFQQFNLISYLNVLENITLSTKLNAARLKRVTSRTLVEEAKFLAEKLGILHLLASAVSQISVGEQQRVAVARALCGSPEIIIADEPTSALDAVARDDFLELVFDLIKNIKSTLIFVSHDLSLHSRFSRKVSLQEINSAALRVAQ